MDLHFRNGGKLGKAAAAKATTNILRSGKKCSTSPQKPKTPEIGAAHVLELPLGVKLPVFPGMTNVLYRTHISEKLYQPFWGFNLTDPYCQLMETTYNNLHDPHLKSYYHRNSMLTTLRRGGFITSNNNVICSLSEFNKYRQYLTRLKIDTEREYKKQHNSAVNPSRPGICYAGHKVHDNCDAAKLQQYPLRKEAQAAANQELVMNRGYLDRIRKEMKIEDRTEYQRLFCIQKEDRMCKDHHARRLHLCGKIEEEWKDKEKFLLTKLGEEAARDMTIEQCERIREKTAQKRQAYLEKKIHIIYQKCVKMAMKKNQKEEPVRKKAKMKQGLFTFLKLITRFVLVLKNYHPYYPVSRMYKITQQNKRIIKKKAKHQIP
ncbi:fibrous sheath-interacting protein 2-like [Octodon degus]|uniref:Fibrous sheath-interacting protein 2-like n=1 Tax=Octodon degus TaxID=10160 RepID=A0A6P6EQK2_OCTDE|nr:fibrous sheath-interacting protein 2-like [Octodon degus]